MLLPGRKTILRTAARVMVRHIPQLSLFFGGLGLPRWVTDACSFMGFEFWFAVVVFPFTFFSYFDSSVFHSKIKIKNDIWNFGAAQRRFLCFLLQRRFLCFLFSNPTSFHVFLLVLQIMKLMCSTLHEWLDDIFFFCCFLIVYYVHSQCRYPSAMMGLLGMPTRWVLLLLADPRFILNLSC